MRYVIIGWDRSHARGRYLKQCRRSYSGSGPEFTDSILEAAVYDNAAFAAVVTQSDNIANHGLRIKQVSDKEWFEAKLKG